uniref:Uncharacterized protein n=1 Tax=Arundo donax TaxID=35708 RepID=A0A0A9DR57_ARUDO
MIPCYTDQFLNVTYPDYINSYNHCDKEKTLESMTTSTGQYGRQQVADLSSASSPAATRKDAWSHAWKENKPGTLQFFIHLTHAHCNAPMQFPNFMEYLKNLSVNHSLLSDYICYEISSTYIITFILVYYLSSLIKRCT